MNDIFKINNKYSHEENEIISLLTDARNSSREKAIYLLNKAKILCKQVIKSGKYSSYSLMLEVLSDLAQLSIQPSERYRFWNECLEFGLKEIDHLKEPSFLDLLSRKVVDFMQDPNVEIPIKVINHILSTVKSKTAFFLNELELHSEEKARLLSRKASLLRNSAKYRPSRMAQQKVSNEAIRCAQKAVYTASDLWDVHLELGLSILNYSQFEKSDASYHRVLKLAESSFWESIKIKQNVYNLLSICRFFQLTYQTLPFLECFERYLLLEYNKTRLLRDTCFYGEAVMNLWYLNCPKDLLNKHVAEAENLLEEAISAGYGSARHIVNLAYIKAVKGEVEVGREILDSLHSLDKGTSWTKIAEIVTSTESGDDLITQGFAMGIDSSAIWNKLGTC